MSNPIIKMINVETGEEIEREMTDVEFRDFVNKAKEEEQNRATRLAEAEAKAAARQAILDRLGLTEEEAKLLLG